MEGTILTGVTHRPHKMCIRDRLQTDQFVFQPVSRGFNENTKPHHLAKRNLVPYSLVVATFSCSCTLQLKILECLTVLTPYFRQTHKLLSYSSYGRLKRIVSINLFKRYFSFRDACCAHGQWRRQARCV